MQHRHCSHLLTRHAITAVLLSIWGWGSAAHAGSTAHRCTDAQGRTTYSQVPCRGDQAHTELQRIDDVRTAAQQRQATEMAGRDHQLGQRLARDRQQLERQAAHMQVQRLSPEPAQRTRTSAQLDPRAPVAAYRCKPPRCYEARVPKARKPLGAVTAASAP